MSALGTTTFVGASGKEYRFVAYPWNAALKAVGAVFLITNRKAKLDGDGEHLPVYVGQTDNLSRHFGNHYKLDCFKRYKANCVCVLFVEDEQRRLRIVSEVQAKYNPVCNN